MGYGGSKKEAAQVTQKTGDEGIDGLINEDHLGLDVVYIQAKRWKHNIGRPEIENFVGARAGKKAAKGIFITTSEFHDNAPRAVSPQTEEPMPFAIGESTPDRRKPVR